MKETTAKLRYLRMSPRKVRLLTDAIRGLTVAQALAQLQFSDKTAARPIRKLLQSAVANALHNDHLQEATLRVVRSVVDGGPMAYRFKPRAFGRAAPIRRRTAHVTIVLAGEEEKKI
ncbi:MAG: 50S ribosomal protein L22 [Candidatus Magasanikbacteria bacterium]|nr:50S ribosomal protein L22 [Candidatus Magasanikbacteria bacterium]